MKLGVFISLRRDEDDIEKKFKWLSDMGMSCCQVNCWDQTVMTTENAELIKKASEKYNVEVTALWCGW